MSLQSIKDIKKFPNCWLNSNKLLLLLVLLVLVAPADSQSLISYPRLINIQAEDHAFVMSNWMISQDLDRNIKFANSMGMVSYDGTEWDVNEMPYKKMLRAIRCYENKIFVGAFGEFGYWEKDAQLNDQYISLSNLLPDRSIENEEIWNIVTRESSVLFQSFGKIYEYRQNEVVEIIPPYSISLISNVYHRQILQVNGKGLMELLPDNSFKMVSEDPHFLSHAVKFILPYQDDDFLIGTSAGMFTLEDKKLSPWNELTNDLFDNDQLNKGIKLKSGQYCIGTISDGLYIADSFGNIEFHYQKSIGLSSNNIISILEDEDENVWVSSNLGLDYLELNSNLIHFVDHHGQYGTIFSGKIFQDNLYLGTNQGLFVSRWNDQSQLDLELLPGTDGLIWELYVVNDQLLCGHNRGTFQIEGYQAKLISNISGGRGFKRIPWRRNLLIQGTYTGLVILNIENEEIVFKDIVKGFNTVVEYIEFGEDHTFWIANPYQGLYRIKLNDDCDSVLVINTFGLDEGLPSIHNLELLKINQEIYVLVNNELYRYDLGLDGFVRDRSMNLNTVTPGRPLEVLNDSLYVLFDKQVSKVHKGNAQLNESTLQHDSREPNMSYLGDGMIIVSRSNEFTIWDTQKPSNSLIHKIPQKIHRICYSENDILKLSCVEDDQSTHEIAAKSRYVIRFEYALPIYNLKPRYRYKLAGFDNQWSAWTINGSKEYTNLSKGSYNFIVENDVNDHQASFQFEIRPFWYQTNIAYVLYIIGGVLLGFAIRRFYRIKLQREMRRMEVQKARELQRQRLELQFKKLQDDVEAKKIELANYAGSLVRKNDVLQKLRSELNVPGDQSIYRLSSKLNKIIDQHLSSEQDWEKFEASFNEIHDAFFKKLKHDFPELKPGDLKLAAYLKMNLSSKEISTLMNISIRGVENKRYRLRKKMHISPNQNLTNVIMTY